MKENQNPPDILYHYTKMDGLLGILSTNPPVLRATDILYLNDSSEYEYAISMLQKIISERLKPLNKLVEMKNQIEIMSKEKTICNKNWETKKQMIERTALNCVAPILKKTDPKDSVSAYICSFSRIKDQLSQWQGYSVKGDGFCIGIKAENLFAQLKDDGFSLVSCIYSKNEQKKIIKEIIEKVHKIYKNYYDSEEQRKPTGEENEKLLHEAMRHWVKEATRMKHPSFEQEKEWRFIKTMMREKNDKYVKFRQGKSFIVPFIEVKFDVNTIKEIIVGPTPHPELSKMSVEGLLRKHGNKDCKVEISKIPYRSW